jgi:signal transduction histidine kinase
MPPQTAPEAPSAAADAQRINGRCVLRRNVATQPYGRCSVCSLQLSGCHAWQSNGYSFGIIVLALSSLLIDIPWIATTSILALLALVVVKGMVDHKRTDVLIHQQHQIARHNAALEREVARATAELRETNRALAASSLQLLEADQARLAFLANVTHELRTPLTSVRGAAQNLADGVVGPLGDKQREYVGIIESETTRLMGVVNELLEFARSATDRVELAPSDVDLLAVAQQTAAQIAPAAQRAEVAVRVDGERATVSADADKTKQILLNLVDNAVKFSPRGARVTIRVKSVEDAAVVEVEDEGEGIAPEELTHLFERFFRASASRDRPGTGLGLAIARNLARLHGGDVHARSTPGNGSTFALTLPRDLDVPLPAGALGELPRARDLRMQRLLPIVEG